MKLKTILLIISLFISSFAIQAQEKAKDHYKAGSKNFKKGLFAPSIEGFTKAIELDKNYIKAYFYRARAYLYKGDTTNAINDLTTAMEKDSCFIDTYYLLASVMTAQKKYNQADKYLELALKCKQKDVSN